MPAQIVSCMCSWRIFTLDIKNLSWFEISYSFIRALRSLFTFIVENVLVIALLSFVFCFFQACLLKFISEEKPDYRQMMETFSRTSISAKYFGPGSQSFTRFTEAFKTYHKPLANLDIRNFSIRLQHTKYIIRLGFPNPSGAAAQESAQTLLSYYRGLCKLQLL